MLALKKDMPARKCKKCRLKGMVRAWGFVLRETWRRRLKVGRV